MKKIYYVPGFISALLIPLLFMYYINPYIDFTKYNVMDVVLPSKDLQKKSNEISENLEPFRNWNYKNIEVSSAKENSPLYVSELKNLQKRNEKNTGIEFILNENSAYGDFVSVLNDMAIAKHETYTFDLEKSGNIIAVTNYKTPSPIDEKFECLLCNDRIGTYEEDPSAREAVLDYIRRQHYISFFENISKLPSGAYYIIFGFLLFLNISMFSIKERFQLQLK